MRETDRQTDRQTQTERERENSKTIILEISNVRSIWTNLTAGP